MRTSGVDKIWLWVHYTKIPIYPIFYLLKGDYRVQNLVFRVEGSRLGCVRIICVLESRSRVC